MSEVPLPWLIALHLILFSTVFWASSAPMRWDLIVASSVLAFGLAVASSVDMQKFEIPDTASLGLIPAGLAAVMWFDVSQIWAHVGAAVFWSVVFFATSEIYFRARGVDGLGLGDAKLMTAIGAWLGPMGSITALLIASVSGIAVLLVVRVLRPNVKAAGIAFGPFLAAGAWMAWTIATP